MEIEDDDDEEELCPCGGVALRLETAGGSAFSGLWESSEMPPLPLPFTAGAADVTAVVVVAGLWAPVWVCSEDLGEGVAVDMAEMGEEAAELPCVWGVEGRTAGWMLLIFLWESGVVDDVDPSDGPSPSWGPFPPASRADSLGLSALRLGFSPPSATLPLSSECTWLARLSACAVLPSADGRGDGVLPSEPPLPRDVAGVLLSLVADAPGAAPPEVEEWGREGGDGRWLWGCGCGDGAWAECPTWLLGCMGAVELDVWGCERVPSLVEPVPCGADPFWGPWGRRVEPLDSERRLTKHLSNVTRREFRYLAYYYCMFCSLSKHSML